LDVHYYVHMTSKHTIPISEARKRIFDIAEDVQKPGQYYTLTEKGRAKAVVMSADEFESLMETMEVLAEFPDLPKDIAQVDRDIKSGKYKTYTTLEQILAREGYVLADKSKKSYAVSDKVRKKSRKGSR